MANVILVGVGLLVIAFVAWIFAGFPGVVCDFSCRTDRVMDALNQIMGVSE